MHTGTTFIGRENELNALKDAWQRTIQGSTNIVVLVGESRLGKTRIVQEFYGWLNSHEDPDDYWPDSLEKGRDSLEVNPKFDLECAHRAILPWLWWGIRWQTSVLRNPVQTSSCAVLSEARHLDSHLEGVRRLVAAKQVNREALINASTKAISLLSGGAFDAAISVAELVRTWISVRRAGGKERRSIADQRYEETGDMLDALSNLLVRVVCGNDVRSGGVPLVLVLDDVQWADQQSMRFVRELAGHFTRVSNGFPHSGLLIVATCWEREWNDSYDLPRVTTAPSFGAVVRTLEDSTKVGTGLAPQVTVLRLQPIDAGLENIVGNILPGLTENQRALVARRSGGSPGFLMELLLKIQRSRRLFEQSNPFSKLTTSGEATVATMSVQYQDLVEERLLALGEPDARILRIASYFGVRFSRTLLVDAAIRICSTDLALNPVASINGILQRADHPLALIQRVGEGTMEFRLPIYQEILRRHLAESEGADDQFRQNIYHTIESLARECTKVFPEPELQSFLEFSETELSGRMQKTNDDATHITFLVVAAHLLRNGNGSNRFARWFEVWRRAHAAILTIPASALRSALRYARVFDLEKVVEIAKTVLEALSDPNSIVRIGSLRTLCLVYLGDARLLQGDQESALDALSKAISYGEAAKATHLDEGLLEDMTMAHTKLGNILSEQDNVEAAQQHYSAGLDLAETIVSRYGETEERTSRVELQKSKTGDLSMNIGLVVNQYGKICMVHDAPFEETPLWVGYHIDKRQLEIILDTNATYPIDWLATEEFHQSFLQINKILMIRMRDQKPVAGYDTYFYRIRNEKIVD